MTDSSDRGMGLFYGASVASLTLAGWTMALGAWLGLLIAAACFALIDDSDVQAWCNRR